MICLVLVCVFPLSVFPVHVSFSLALSLHCANEVHLANNSKTRAKVKEEALPIFPLHEQSMLNARRVLSFSIPSDKISTLTTKRFAHVFRSFWRSNVMVFDLLLSTWRDFHYTQFFFSRNSFVSFCFMFLHWQTMSQLAKFGRHWKSISVGLVRYSSGNAATTGGSEQGGDNAEKTDVDGVRRADLLLIVSRFVTNSFYNIFYSTDSTDANQLLHVRLRKLCMDRICR